jgi:hypothetical protein
MHLLILLLKSLEKFDPGVVEHPPLNETLRAMALKIAFAEAIVDWLQAVRVPQKGSTIKDHSNPQSEVVIRHSNSCTAGGLKFVNRSKRL